MEPSGNSVLTWERNKDTGSYLARSVDVRADLDTVPWPCPHCQAEVPPKFKGTQTVEVFCDGKLLSRRVLHPCGAMLYAGMLELHKQEEATDKPTPKKRASRKKKEAEPEQIEVATAQPASLWDQAGL